ncbi:MAG: dehydrogenase, partial [Propionibacteriaceae bacterium]|jgi:2-oxoisovalerate dehydrogenase E1 component|nr:dehydrogenase [Propionibacteriaceae bacterium]
MAIYGAEGLFAVLYDMIVVREFESMLWQLATTGQWQGVSCDQPVAEYLALGQEAAVVGQALELGPDDLVFGSHRSLGQVLAKSLSAIRALGPGPVAALLESEREAATLAQAEAIGFGNPVELSENFVLFGLMAECLGLKAGLNQGLAGASRAHFPPFGSMPNSATPGACAPLALGAALFKRINRRPGIVVANLGDAALAAGPVWETVNFASMEQYHSLWPASAGGRPPLLVTVLNNFYGLGSRTVGETTGLDVLARVGAGVDPEAMHAERIDGFNPLAVANAMRRKRELLEGGAGPVLLDVVTYRYNGHWPGENPAYRSQDEIAQWRAVDPIETYGELLVHNAITTRTAVEEVRQGLRERLTKLLRRAVEAAAQPDRDAALVETVMFAGQRVESLDPPRKPELSQPLNDNSRIRAIQAKSRRGRDDDGRPLSKLKTYQLRDGLFEAVAHRFTIDPTLAAWGQDNRDCGGAFAVYRGLSDLAPAQRLFNAPFAPAAVVGAGIGYALAGGRALVEVMYDDLLGRAGDELLNQAGSWRAWSGGRLRTPLVIRCAVGVPGSGQHAQDWSALAARVPGLKVYYPASPSDAKGMLGLALAGCDPVVLLEAQSLYDKAEEFDRAGVPLGHYETEEGQPAVRREGSDLTIVTLGPTLYRGLAAAETLQESHDVSAEVIDLRFLNPLDLEPVVASVRKTGRLLLVSDEAERGSSLHRVANAVQEAAFDVLDSAPVVLGARNLVVTPSLAASDLFPQVDTILDAIHQRILSLEGREPGSDQSPEELLRRQRLGI